MEIDDIFLHNYFANTPRPPRKMNILNLLKNTLKDIPYFNNLSAEELQKFSNKATLVHLQCQETLLKQGELGEEVYVLIDGRLRAIRENEEAEPIILGEISKGEIVGEMAALIGEKRNATIYAIRDSLLLCFRGDDFVDLLQQQHSSIKQLIQTVTARTKKSFSPKQTVHSVALVPISKGLELGVFKEHLTEAFQPYMPLKVLSQAVFEEENGSKFNERDNFDKELSNYEKKDNFLLYWTDGKWNNWTKHCLHRADKILFIADALQAHKVGAFEKKVLDLLSNVNHAAQELVLIHPSRNKTPTKTRRWLQKRNLQKHYHIAWNERKDVERLARFLTGNAIGVALSGGGMRAVVQSGILHAMLEGGIPVDIIGGSSGGAFIGAVVAHINEATEFRPSAIKAQKVFKSTTQFTPPIVSLFSGKRLTKAIQAFFGKVKIEDLWTDFFCPSLSLVTGKLMIHQTGPLWKAVRASTSVMGIFPPVLDGDDCLVDGGLINACPTNILAQIKVGKTIVINASTKSGIQTEAKFDPSVSGWNLLWKKLNPFYKKNIVPNIGTCIIQSMYMASNHLQAQVYANSKIDLFIEPPIENVDSDSGSDSGMELYEYGYQYGLSQVENWKEQLGLNYPNSTHSKNTTYESTAF